MTSAPFRIAIIDDNESVRRATRRMIGSYGMLSETFASAREFLACLESTHSHWIDCLVLDVHMPESNGIMLQKHLNDAGFKVPIIVISGHEDALAMRQALDAGAVAFLRKPFHGEVFIRTLREALVGAGAGTTELPLP